MWELPHERFQLGIEKFIEPVNIMEFAQSVVGIGIEGEIVEVNGYLRLYGEVLDDTCRIDGIFRFRTMVHGVLDVGSLVYI